MTNNYPNAKILLAYTIVGSLIGSLLYLLLWLGDEIFSSISYLRLPNLDIKNGNIYFIFFIYGVVAMAGAIPAFITGGIITMSKIRTNSHWDYLKIFTIGFIVTLILVYVLTIVVSFYIPPITKLLLGNQNKVFLTLSGALSAVIIGKWILPKRVQIDIPYH